MKNLLRQFIDNLFRRPSTHKSVRRRVTLRLEELESRLTPATLTIDGAGNATLAADAGETNAFVLDLNTGTSRYEFTDNNNLISATGAGTGPANVQGAGTNTVTALASFLTSITLQTGNNSDTVALKSTGIPTTVTSLDGNDTVTITNAGSVQGIAGTVHVTTIAGLTTLIVDDSADPTSRSVTLSDSTLHGLAPADITFDSSSLSGFTLDGGTGGSNFTVTNTPGSTNTLNLNSSHDSVTVTGTQDSTALTINSQTGDQIILGDSNPSSNITVNGGGTVTNAWSSTANLTITKADNDGGNSTGAVVGTAIPGDAITYTITVSNTGPDAVPAAVNDSFSIFLTEESYTATATGGAYGFTPSGTGDINDNSVTLPVNSSITYTVDATVVSSASGTLSNTATVTQNEGTSSGSPISATDTDNLTPQADLVITKSDNGGGSSSPPTVGSAPSGGTLTYTITVSNTGPSDAPGAVIADAFPVDITSDTYTAVGTGGASGFTASGSSNINDTVGLPAGTSITYTVTADISSSASGTMSNVVSVTPPSGVTDTNASTTATDSDMLAKLGITKSDNDGGNSTGAVVGTAVPGETITYTITVSNTGTGSPSATVTDSFPGSLTAVSYTAVATGGASGFTASGNGNIDDLAVILPAGSSVTYTVDATIVSSATGTLSNTATLNQNGPTFTASATDTDNLTPQADLVITKSDNVGGTSSPPTVGTATPGGTITYTIVVSNTGPSDAPGTGIADTFPGAITSDTYTAVGTGGASGFTASGSGNINDTVGLPAGTSVTYTVTASISSSASGTLTNSATLTPPGGVTDTNASTSATDSDTLLTANQQLIIALANNHNFFIPSQGLFENFFGGGEKWIEGNINSFGNPWYFITTAGDLWEWNGTHGLNGSLLMSMGETAWENPELVVDASTLTAANPAQVAAADQVRGFYRSSAGDFFLNFFGGQEKWIEGEISAKAPANEINLWYFILPNGSVYEWSGSGLNGTLVTTITPDVNLYKNPSLLYDAYQDATVNSAGWDQQRHFYFDSSKGLVRNLWEDFLGLDEKWFRGDTNQFGNPWYFLLPNGNLMEWNGFSVSGSNLLANLGPHAWNDFERVVTDFVPTFTVAQNNTLIALDQTHSLFRASHDTNFFFSFFGQQEKWLEGAPNSFSNPWYILLPNNSLLEWNGSNSAAGNVLATNLPPQIYLDPLLLSDAFADGSLLDTAVKLNPFGPNSGGPGDHL